MKQTLKALLIVFGLITVSCALSAGVKEDVTRLKNKGKSWSQIMQTLSSQYSSKAIAEAYYE